MTEPHPEDGWLSLPQGLRLDLPQGLSGSALAELDRLATDAVGPMAPPEGGRAAVPFLWPILALSSAPAGALRDQLASDAETLIVHETLRLRADAPAPAPDSGLQICLEPQSASGTRFSVRFLDSHGWTLADLTAGVRRMTARDLCDLKSVSLTRVARGLPLHRLTTPPLPQSCVDDFVALVQDPNPIHTDPAAAQIAGARQTIVPGALLAAMIEPALPALLATETVALRSVSLRFMSVMETGNPVTFATLDPNGQTDAPLRVFLARPDGMLVAIADLEIAR